MKQTKHLLATMAVLLCSVTASAENVEIDGIWYNLVSKVNQAEVTFEGDSYNSYSNEYSGSITLPTAVIYDDVAYSVTSIGEDAFRGCSNLISITIPEGVTSIGSSAFEGCSSLTSITIPESVTSIGSHAFSGCTSLITITIPEGVTSIGQRAFSGCSNLTAITIPESVTKIGNFTFLDCSGLIAITIPEGVTSIGDFAFSHCSSLTSIIIPESVAKIGSNAFSGCSNLTAITIPEGVTSIGSKAFSGCISLTAINIPEGVTSIGSSTFEGCSSLTAIVLPKNVRSIGSEAFAGCSELTDVYCNAETVPSTKVDAFDGSYPDYATLHVPACALESYKTTAPWSSFSTIVPLTDEKVTSITLSQTTATLAGGESLILTATVSPKEATDQSVTWTSSNEDVATVDNNGNVKAVASGIATITATANDGSGVSASCEVTVEMNVVPTTLPIVLTEADGLLATTSTNSTGTLQYEFTSELFTLDEATRTIYLTFLKGNSTNDALCDASHYPYVALSEFYLYDGEGNEIALNASNFSTNAQEPSEGPIANICDGDRSSFWHSKWSGTGVGDYHYLKITLPEGQELTEFKFGYITRNTRQCLPGAIHIGTTNDNISFSLSGSYGENMNWSFIDGNLVVEGTGVLDWNVIGGLGGIKSVEVKERITAIGENAFRGCSSLTSITIPESVTSIGNYAFYNCSSLTAVHISSIEAWCKISFNGNYSNPLYYAHNLYLNGELVTELVIPEGVTSIGKDAFYQCSSLTSITIPEGVTSIGEGTFCGCSSLTDITIPESVTSIGSSAFLNCSIPTAVYISSIEAWCEISFANFFSNPLSNAGRLYLNGALIRELVVPEGVKSIGDYAFCRCNFASITIPEGVTEIGVCAFGESYIRNITIPESVILIGKDAFYRCYRLTSITIPEGVTSIGEGTFYGCSSLTDITIPESVTSIGSNAFYDCDNLTSIIIPKGVESIGSRAFAYCSGLTYVYCYAETVPSTEIDAFVGSSIESATLYVPADALESYKASAPWNEFGNLEIESDVSVTITIDQYGSGTYCSKYALDFSAVEGLKAYAATGYNNITGVVTLTRVMTAQPGEGLFIKCEPGKYMVPIMESTGDYTTNMLVGTLAKTEVNATSDDGLYANYKYTIKADEATPKFYQFADGSTLGAGKAYLQIPTAWLPATDEAKSISLRFEEGEGTTDMENSQFIIDNSQFTIHNSQLTFDLYGRRVAQPVKGGIYIVGGRKVVY